MTSTTHPKNVLIKMIRFVIPIFFIAASIAAANFLYATRPLAQRGRPLIPPPLVETMTVTAANHFVTLEAMGTVIPSRSITLKSRVGGFVQEKSKKLIPGGLFNKGEVMIRLEPADFLLDVDQQKAALAKRHAELRLEMGKQEVAREEVKILQNSSRRSLSNSDLALREPQLAQIKADIAAAQTDLSRATLALERTVIKAPFNCMVMAVNVEPGSQISSQDPLASLSGTDDYWVEATLPTDQLKWVDIPLKNHGIGSPARIITPGNPPRPGHVIRLLGTLGKETRLATLLITIEDPLGLRDQAPPLLLDSYVRIRIQGAELSHVIALPRDVVRDGDQVWCAGADQKLVIKPIETIWRDAHRIFVSGGLEPDDNIIVSDMASPVAGMAIRVKNQNKADIDVKMPSPLPGESREAQEATDDRSALK